MKILGSTPCISPKEHPCDLPEQNVSGRLRDGPIGPLEYIPLQFVFLVVMSGIEIVHLEHEAGEFFSISTNDELMAFDRRT